MDIPEILLITLINASLVGLFDGAKSLQILFD